MSKSKKIHIGIVNKNDELYSLKIGQHCFVTTEETEFKKLRCVVSSINPRWSITFLILEEDRKGESIYYKLDEFPKYVYDFNSKKCLLVEALNEISNGSEFRTEKTKTKQLSNEIYKNFSKMSKFFIFLRICKIYGLNEQYLDYKMNLINPLSWIAMIIYIPIFYFAEGFSNTSWKDCKSSMGIFPEFYPYNLVYWKKPN